MSAILPNILWRVGGSSYHTWYIVVHTHISNLQQGTFEVHVCALQLLYIQCTWLLYNSLKYTWSACLVLCNYYIHVLIQCTWLLYAASNTPRLYTACVHNPPLMLYPSHMYLETSAAWAPELTRPLLVDLHDADWRMQPSDSYEKNKICKWEHSWVAALHVQCVSLKLCGAFYYATNIDSLWPRR